MALRSSSLKRLAIADTVLSRLLRALTDAGLLARVPYRAGGRTRPEYVLTQAGADGCQTGLSTSNVGWRTPGAPDELLELRSAGA